MRPPADARDRRLADYAGAMRQIMVLADEDAARWHRPGTTCDGERCGAAVCRIARLAGAAIAAGGWTVTAARTPPRAVTKVQRDGAR